MIDQLLLEIAEDKHTNLTTTSDAFKRDLWKFFFEPKFSHRRVIEFGTHKGQTTRILSHLFDDVITVNVSEKHFEAAKLLNADRTNIRYIGYDLYANPVQDHITEDVIDVFFIDAGHETYHIESDMARALYMNRADEVYFIFDDYGLHDPVFKVINAYVAAGLLSIVATIGHDAGHSFGGVPPRVLKRSEGVICRLNNDKIEYE